MNKKAVSILRRMYESRTMPDAASSELTLHSWELFRSINIKWSRVDGFTMSDIVSAEVERCLVCVYFNWRRMSVSNLIENRACHTTTWGIVLDRNVWSGAAQSIGSRNKSRILGMNHPLSITT